MDQASGVRREWPLLLAILLDLIGFGMVLPDVQLKAERLGAPGWLIGIILSSLFVVQFFVSPLWGSLSDRVGRKRVILACTFLSALSWAAYAYADSLWWIFVSRILGGLAAANVVVAQAYLADVTSEGDRQDAMGRLGAALSTGLILGPAIAAYLMGQARSDLIGWSAFSFSLTGVLVLAMFLKPAEHREEQKPGRRGTIDFSLLSQVPRLRPLVLLAVVSWFALACLEGTFGRLVVHYLQFNAGVFGLIFSFESFLAVIVQGWLVGHISAKLSLTALLRLGFGLQGLGLLLTPFGLYLPLLFLYSGVYSIGSGLANPTLNGACSNLTPTDRQGELFGLLQGARSVGFILGPSIGGALFDLSMPSPYLLAGAVGIAAALLVPRIPQQSKVPG